MRLIPHIFAGNPAYPFFISISFKKSNQPLNKMGGFSKIKKNEK
jgi:hypothetical protein